MPKVVGIPIKLIHEAEGHVITVETTMGEVYRGQMIEAEDSMNLALANVTMTAADGRQSRLEHVYLRGSKIRFVILPDMLRNAPMFKRLADSKNRRTQGPGIGKKQH
jgi:small nuclear ribonucleoprotein D3